MPKIKTRKFRYYVTNLNAGEIQGTDSTEDANAFAASDDYFVLDAEAGLWLTGGDPLPVRPVGE